jgi:hypothetical protein
MHRLVPRSLLVAAVSVTVGVAAAPAQAFTPPIGTDKGSVVAQAPASAGPDHAAATSAPARPAADGIIAILIG